MFHKEGFKIILITMVMMSLGIIAVGEWVSNIYFQKAIQISFLSITILVLQFFRNPKRHTLINANHIIAPVDGEVVAIEEVVESEFFKDKRRQISIFMTPLNVMLPAIQSVER